MAHREYCFPGRDNVLLLLSLTDNLGPHVISIPYLDLSRSPHHRMILKKPAMPTALLARLATVLARVLAEDGHRYE